MTMEAPAEPILALNIWLSMKSGKTNVNDRDEEFHTQSQKISSGLKAIDDALDGGLEHGAVHCIVSEPDEETRELLQALLVSHLRSSPHATATLIESTSSLDVRRLHQTLEGMYSASGAAAETALQTLDRLKIMRVFDYVGLTEAVSELRGTMEGVASPDTEVEVSRKVPKSTIADSEDEDEMLDSPSWAAEPAPATATDAEQSSGLVIIDNISQVMAPLIKNNYTHGQACLSSFMRSVKQLTRAYGLCTVLVSHASSKPAADEEALSLFTSCTIRPALGAGFGFLVDLLMYLHSVPSKKKKEGTHAETQGRAGNMVSVLEVVQDKQGERSGRWAPFICDPDGRLQEVS